MLRLISGVEEDSDIGRKFVNPNQEMPSSHVKGVVASFEFDEAHLSLYHDRASSGARSVHWRAVVGHK